MMMEYCTGCVPQNKLQVGSSGGGSVVAVSSHLLFSMLHAYHRCYELRLQLIHNNIHNFGLHKFICNSHCKSLKMSHTYGKTEKLTNDSPRSSLVKAECQTTPSRQVSANEKACRCGSTRHNRRECQAKSKQHTYTGYIHRINLLDSHIDDIKNCTLIFTVLKQASDTHWKPLCDALMECLYSSFWMTLYQQGAWSHMQAQIMSKQL